MGRLVSICIPTHSAKRLPYLREAVASARAQTHADVESLLSDNGKDEEVLAFGREAEALDPRIRFTRNDRPLGLGGNFNAVLHRARGEYAIIIGDDDRLLPPFCEGLLAACGEETAVVFSNHYVIDEAGAVNDELTRRFLASYGRASLRGGPVADAAACVWRNSVPMSAALIRTKDGQRLGIKPDLSTPDIELFARLAAEGREFVFVPEWLAEYRVHVRSETSNGLGSERLLPYLDPITVPDDVEPLKRQFMSGILGQAVNAALATGDVEGARRLLLHRYYPRLRERPAYVAVHHAIAALPPALSRWSFEAVVDAKRRLAKTKRKLAGAVSPVTASR